MSSATPVKPKDLKPKSDPLQPADSKPENSQPKPPEQDPTKKQKVDPYAHERSEEQAAEHGKEVPYDQEEAEKFEPKEENDNKNAKIRKQGESLK